jgi:hypothetical protein
VVEETFEERCDRERREAGLPDHIEDEVTLHKVATIVIEHDRDRGVGDLAGAS